MKRITLIQVLKIINSGLMANNEIGEEKKTIITEKMLDEDLSEKGMDSIAFINIIVSLEEEFECELPDEKLILSEMNTVNKIMDVLYELESSANEKIAGIIK